MIPILAECPGWKRAILWHWGVVVFDNDERDSGDLTH